MAVTGGFPPTAFHVEGWQVLSFNYRKSQANPSWSRSRSRRSLHSDNLQHSTFVSTWPTFCSPFELGGSVVGVGTQTGTVDNKLLLWYNVSLLWDLGGTELFAVMSWCLLWEDNASVGPGRFGSCWRLLKTRQNYNNHLFFSYSHTSKSFYKTAQGEINNVLFRQQISV